MAKKILISGYIGFGNFGDEAILKCLISYLKSKNAEISVLSNAPNETAREYSIKAYKFNSPLQIIMAILSCNVLFSGGGSLLQNNTSNKSLIYYLLIIWFAKLIGKKVVIFAQGLEGIKGKKMLNFASKILKKCDLITVRDKNSKAIANKMGLESNLVCDPFYDTKLPPYEPKGQVGIQVRSCKYMHPLFPENLANRIVEFFGDRPIKIFVFQEKEDRNISTELMTLLQKKSKNINVEIIPNSGIESIVNHFKELEYLISMRYHACLLGTMYGIKTMPVVYDDKILTFAKEVNLPYIKCDFDEMKKDSFKDLENANYKSSQKFVWDIYDKFVQ